MNVQGQGPAAPGGQSGGVGSGGVGPVSGTGPTTPSSCKPDPLANFRDIIYSQDGWGGNQVNQDTQWDVPASPEPANKEIPLWKQTASNGTEVWEVNLRNGGQAPPPISKSDAPWGRTPTNNIGGTWGEEDENNDSQSVWTGVPNNGSSQWGAGGMGAGPAGIAGPIAAASGPAGPPIGSGIPAGNGMWGGPKPKEPEWPGPAIGPGGPAGWGDVRPSRMGMSGMGGPTGPDAMQAAGMMQGPGAPSHWPGAQNKPGVSQWSGGSGMGPPKEMKSSGWDEHQSPPAQKRPVPVPNFDDGTSVWGNPQMQQGSVSRWKDMPNPNVANRGMQQTGPPPNRGMPPGPGMKSDMPAPWSQSRNGAWGDGSAEGMGWDEKPVVGSTPWNEPPQTPTPWAAAGSKPKTPTTPSWGGDGDDGASWGQPPKQGPKPLAKEMIWASKQFKILSEMGFKRDDVENVLRACNMVMEDALEMLRSGRGMGMESSWHRPAEDHSAAYDPMGHHGTPYPPGQRFNPGQQMPFHPGGRSGAHHLLNNPASALGLNPNPAFKLLQQQQPPPIPPQVMSRLTILIVDFYSVYGPGLSSNSCSLVPTGESIANWSA